MQKLSGTQILVVLFINIMFGGLAVEYVIEYWGAFFKGAAVDVPFFACAVAGLFLAGLAYSIAIVTWLISFMM